MKVENSDYNIVVSDGEENSSGAGSVKNAVELISQKLIIKGTMVKWYILQYCTRNKRRHS